VLGSFSVIRIYFGFRVSNFVLGSFSVIRIYFGFRVSDFGFAFPSHHGLNEGHDRIHGGPFLPQGMRGLGAGNRSGECGPTATTPTG
jgi:hypothetical protein